MSDYERAYEAVEGIFSDTSVPAEETAARLKSIRDQIDENLSALRDDGVDVRSVVPAERPSR